ncbi:MAG: NAD(P)-dependent alcohol dehydrogenase [Ornithinimicrobium sp.]
MKAIVYTTYGSPDELELRDVTTPVVSDHEVLVRVHAASINPADWHYLTGTPYLVHLVAGLRKPKRNIPGIDLAGTVEAVGPNVRDYTPGDEVFGWTGGGACAEYVAVPEQQLAPKPAEASFEQSSTLGVAAFTALQGLRDHGQVSAGHQVLINGASGGVGTFAVQFAKSLGAEVTAVCSTRNVDIVTGTGADHTIDYTQADFTDTHLHYDVVLDVAGNRSLSDSRSVLKPEGILVMIGGPKGKWLGPIPRLLKARLMSLGRSQKMGSMYAHETKEDLDFFKGLFEAGSLTPVIDRTYPLSQVPEALNYLGEGHAQGKVVITM